jgi:tetratricopeptide (TPR) repeat protein
MLQRWLAQLEERLAEAITAENKAQIAWLRLQKIVAYLLLRRWRLALLELTRAGMESSGSDYERLALAYHQKARYLAEAGEIDPARDALQQAVNLYTVIEDPAGRSQAWQSVALPLIIRGEFDQALDLLQRGADDLSGEPLRQVSLYQWQMRLHILRLAMDRAWRAMDRAAEAAYHQDDDQSVLSDRIEGYRDVLRPLFDGSQPLDALLMLIVGLGQTIQADTPDADELLMAHAAWEDGRFHQALEIAQLVRQRAMNAGQTDFARYVRYLAATIIRAHAYEQLGERTAALVAFNEARQWLDRQLGYTDYIDTILAHWADRWGSQAFQSAQRQAQRWEKSS